MDWVDWVIREVAELPDRTSPDNAPNEMTVTAEELRGILERAPLPELSHAVPNDGG